MLPVLHDPQAAPVPVFEFEKRHAKATQLTPNENVATALAEFMFRDSYMI
jgi:hypothetical protein